MLLGDQARQVVAAAFAASVALAAASTVRGQPNTAAAPSRPRTSPHVREWAAYRERLLELRAEVRETASDLARDCSPETMARLRRLSGDAERRLRCYFDEEGCLVIQGRLDAEQGALIM